MFAFENILQTLKKEKNRLIQEYSIQSLALFGSYSRNEQTLDSDIDIMVELGTDHLGLRFIDLAEDLEKILEHKVDLVSKDAIKPRYWVEIEQDIKYV